MAQGGANANGSIPTSTQTTIDTSGLHELGGDVDQAEIGGLVPIYIAAQERPAEAVRALHELAMGGR